MGELDRYHRQILLPGIGEAGQVRLLGAHALIVGCGALGTVIADALARAGVGTLSIVDRDTVELTNLQRQVLFDEADVERMVPKAEAAGAKLRRVNSAITVNTRVDDFSHRNAERHAEGVDVILDGLDNFETRYLLNDLAVRDGIPYIYGGAVATGGMSMAILPHAQHRAQRAPQSSVRWTDEQATPCLRCIFPNAPPAGTTATCDTAGVLGPAVLTIAAHQVTQALKLLSGNVDAVDRSLFTIDVWENTTRRFDVSGARAVGRCPCCVSGCFEFITGDTASATTSLCGRGAIQITPPAASGDDGGLDLAMMAARLSAHGSFTHNGYLLHGRFHDLKGDAGPFELTLFPDGRAIIKGTTVAETARAIYAKYVGS